MSFALPDNMPSLSLSVPTGKSHYGSVELNEELLKAWLNRLPQQNPVEYTRRYIEALDLFNHNEVPPAQRLKLLDMYRAPFNTMMFELSLSKLGQLDLTDEARMQLLNDISMVLEQLATGYKIIVIESGEQNSNLKLNAAGQMSIYRAIEQLSFLALHHYKFYLKLPSRLFRELHQLYLLSVEADVSDKQPFVNKQINAAYTIRERYCQFLLTTICNPYGLNSGEVLKAYQLMMPLVSATKLELLTQSHEVKAGLFYIDCLGDSTPTAATIPKITADKPVILIMDTKSILIKAAKLFEQAEQQGDKHPAAKNIRLLQKLVPYLNTAFQHRQTYVKFEGAKKTFLCVGVTATHQAQLRTESLPVAQHRWLSSEWDILNKNDYGCLLQKRHLAHLFELRVGDLVGLFEQSGADTKPSVRLATIKYIKTDDFNQTKISLEYIAGNAMPVLFTMQDNSEKQPAYLIPEVARTHQPANLITSKGIYAAGRVLHIKMRKKFLNFTIRIDKITDRQSGYDRFSFRDVIEHQTVR